MSHDRRLGPYLATSTGHIYCLYAFLLHAPVDKKFPIILNQTPVLPLLSYMSVIPWSLVLRRPQTCQTSSSPSNKSSSCHDSCLQPHPSQARQTKLVTTEDRVDGALQRGLLLGRSVSGYLIVTCRVGP